MVNFSSSNAGTWFYFNDDDPEQGGVCLRELSTEEATRIEKLTVKVKRKYIRGNMVEVREEDAKQSARLTWDYCIVDWSNVYLDGKPVECTAENKLKLMKCIDFAKFVSECIEKLVETNRALEEARLKNSESISSGNTKSPPAKSAKSSTETKD